MTYITVGKDLKSAYAPNIVYISRAMNFVQIASLNSMILDLSRRDLTLAFETSTIIAS